MVDFRKDYDGRFPEPPYKTELDCESLEAENAALEQRVTAQAELIASLQESLKESEARVAGLLGEVDRVDMLWEYEKNSNRNNVELYEMRCRELEAENKRLREALEKIASGEIYPRTIAKKALGGAE